MRRLAAVATTAIVVGAALSACAGTGASQADGGLVRVGVVGTTSTVDIVDSQMAPLVVSPSLEQLVRLKPDGSLEPWLAESVENPSPTEYIYNLRKGVKFWDGQELTADDVVFSLDRLRDPASYTSVKYESVESVEATGPYTVTVTLSSPDMNWATNAAMFSSQITQKKFHEEHGEDFGKPGTLVMGTGPYEISNLDPIAGATFKANPDYWGGDVGFDELEIKFFDNETNAAIALRAKSIDMVPNVSDGSAFESTSQANIITGPSCSTAYWSMNTRAAPWDDIHVRRAVAYALDRDALVDDVNGYAEPITTLIPPALLAGIASAEDIDAMIASLPQYPYDLDKAKAELAMSAYPDGFTANTLAPAFANSVTGSQIIADQLSKIGITLTVNNTTIPDWQAQTIGPAEKRPSLFVSGQGCTPTPGYWPAYRLGSAGLADGGSNLAAYAPESMDRLLDEAKSAPTPEAQFETLTQVLTQLADDIPYVPLLALKANLGITSGFVWDSYTLPWWNEPWPLNITHEG